MIETLLDWLFPPKCPFCGKVLDRRGEGWCLRCQQTLPWAEGKLGLQKPEFTQGCVSPLFYRDGVREAVHRYKFQNRPGYAGAFVLPMAQSVRDAWSELAFDVVTWVPLAARRRKKRGYDQAELLARGLGEELGLPVEGLLVKVRNNPAQSGQADDGARRVNVLGAYELRPEMTVAGKTVLLVDDVATTGSTLSECARILRTAGAEAVYCATLARARN